MRAPAGVCVDGDAEARVFCSSTGVMGMLLLSEVLCLGALL